MFDSVDSRPVDRGSLGQKERKAILALISVTVVPSPVPYGVINLGPKLGRSEV
jgi:hypothetical protein